MVGSFIFLSIKWKTPIGLALLVASVLGTLLGGEGLGLRHIIEGGFMYLDAILIIVSAMALMGALRRSGALTDIARQLVSAFGHRPVILLPALMLLTDRKSTRLNSSHVTISYAVFCLKKQN